MPITMNATLPNPIDRGQTNLNRTTFAEAFLVAGNNKGEWNMDNEDSTAETALITDGYYDLKICQKIYPGSL